MTGVLIRGDWDTILQQEDHVRTQGEDGHCHSKEDDLGRNQAC